MKIENNKRDYHCDIIANISVYNDFDEKIK